MKKQQFKSNGVVNVNERPALRFRLLAIEGRGWGEGLRVAALHALTNRVLRREGGGTLMMKGHRTRPPSFCVGDRKINYRLFSPLHPLQLLFSSSKQRVARKRLVSLSKGIIRHPASQSQISLLDATNGPFLTCPPVPKNVLSSQTVISLDVKLFTPASEGRKIRTIRK